MPCPCRGKLRHLRDPASSPPVARVHDARISSQSSPGHRDLCCPVPTFPPVKAGSVRRRRFQSPPSPKRCDASSVRSHTSRRRRSMSPGQSSARFSAPRSESLGWPAAPRRRRHSRRNAVALRETPDFPSLRPQLEEPLFHDDHIVWLDQYPIRRAVFDQLIHINADGFRLAIGHPVDRYIGRLG